MQFCVDKGESILALLTKPLSAAIQTYSSHVDLQKEVWGNQPRPNEKPKPGKEKPDKSKPSKEKPEKESEKELERVKEPKDRKQAPAIV
jgi:hypothetical protein